MSARKKSDILQSYDEFIERLQLESDALDKIDERRMSANEKIKNLLQDFKKENELITQQFEKMHKDMRQANVEVTKKPEKKNAAAETKTHDNVAARSKCLEEMCTPMVGKSYAKTIDSKKVTFADNTKF